MNTTHVRYVDGGTVGRTLNDYKWDREDLLSMRKMINYNTSSSSYNMQMLKIQNTIERNILLKWKHNNVIFASNILYVIHTSNKRT